MTNYSTPSEPSKTSSSTEGDSEHRGYRIRVEYPNEPQYRYGSYADGGWALTVRRQAAVLDLEKAREGANYLALTTVKDGAQVTLEEVKSFDPDWCCAPASTIGEMLSYHRFSQEEAAQKLGLSTDDMAKLMRGELLINVELTQKLHEVLGGTPHFWQALETNYREGIRMGLTVFREIL